MWTLGVNCWERKKERKKERGVLALHGSGFVFGFWPADTELIVLAEA